MKKKTLEKCIRMLATAMIDKQFQVTGFAVLDELNAIESNHTSMDIE